MSVSRMFQKDSPESVSGESFSKRRKGEFDMNTTLNMDTELLYCGNHVSGTTDCPDTPPVYYATAYAVKDTVDYD